MAATLIAIIIVYKRYANSAFLVLKQESPLKVPNGVPEIVTFLNEMPFKSLLPAAKASLPSVKRSTG